jgi:hypothetical protein
MMRCGVETPIQVNEQLYSLNEVTGQKELSHFQDPRLNRYSFVWFGSDDDGPGAFSKLLQALLEQWNLPARWVLVWRLTTEHWRNRLRWLIKKRQEEGWTINQNVEVVVAIKPVNDLESLEPANYTGRDGNFFYGFGIPEMEQFARGPLRPTIKHFAIEQPLVPSKEFLVWLANQRGAIAYWNYDDLGRLGLVIVGTLQVQTAKLHAEGIIQEVKGGSEVGKVWNYPPTNLRYINPQDLYRRG